MRWPRPEQLQARLEEHPPFLLEDTLSCSRPGDQSPIGGSEGGRAKGAEAVGGDWRKGWKNTQGPYSPFLESTPTASSSEKGHQR